jgi:purine-binding chemotaxis protein CheW
MQKDKDKSTKPLFDDPFAQADDTGKPEEPPVKPEAELRKRARARPKSEKEPAAAAKPKTPSRKRTAKKTTPKPKSEEKPAAAAKPKTASRKRTAKKTTPKPKSEEKPAAAAKPESRLEGSTAAERKTKAPSSTGLNKAEIDSQIADQDLPDEGIAIGSSHEIFFDPEKGRTLLATLIASIDEGDERAMERATLAALPFVRQIEAIEGKQHVTFALGEYEYAVSIDNVVEIGEPLNATPVPNVPEWVLGVANLRGDIVSVIDLRIFMGLPDADPGQDKRMLVARSSDGEISTCVLVDQVRGIRYLNLDQIRQPTTAVTEFIEEFVDGVCEIEGQEFMVLDFDRVLSSERMQIR